MLGLEELHILHANREAGLWKVHRKHIQSSSQLELEGATGTRALVGRDIAEMTSSLSSSSDTTYTVLSLSMLMRDHASQLSEETRGMQPLIVGGRFTTMCDGLAVCSTATNAVVAVGLAENGTFWTSLLTDAGNGHYNYKATPVQNIALTQYHTVCASHVLRSGDMSRQMSSSWYLHMIFR